MADDIFALGFGVDTSGLAQGKASAADLAKALLDLAKAMKAEEDAAAKSASAEKKKADETKRAADEAAKAANPHLRLADALGRVGTQAQGISGHIANLTQNFMQAGASLSQGGAGGLIGGMNGLLGAGGKLVPMLGGVAAGVATVALGVGAAAVAYGGLIAATYKQQEAFLMLEGRLKNVYGSGSVAADMFKEITILANKNGLAIEATAESFLRLARNNEAIGLTRRQMIDLTDSVQMLGRVSGASQGEVAGGLMQFSQALAAGRLNGDELRSIMENMPALAKAIADGLGVSVGQLRAMGAEGQLTSDKITTSLLGQLPKIREEFENLPQTSEQAFQRVGNAWDTLIANIGTRLNSSGIVVATAQALEYAVSGAAAAIAPETDTEAYTRIMASRANGLGNAGSLSLMDPYGASKGRDDQEVLDLQRRLNVERYQGIIASEAERREGERAPFTRAQGILKEVDDYANKVSKLQANIDSLTLARDKLQNSKPGTFEKEEIAKLDEFNRVIAAQKLQLESALLPLDKYALATDRAAAAVTRYGAGGAASIASEAQGLVDASAAQENPISFNDAESQVVRKRTVDLQTQTQAMDQQIAIQQQLQAAIGGGTDAQIDAEVANKALTLQMQMFGSVMTDDASKALDGYKDKLRELLEIQNETTAAQKLYNAQLQLGIEAQITAAIKAGATAGEIAAMRRNLQLGVDMDAAGGGSLPATAPALGAGIPANRVDGNTVTAGMSADITQIVASVMATYPQVNGISGLRPGDKGSQHSVGTAFDLDLSTLTEAQRKTLVQQLMGGSFGRIGGIGTYNDQATSLHVDTREGRFAWGPNKSKSSLGQTPDWFEDMATSWMAGGSVGAPATPGQPATGQAGTLGQQVVVAEAAVEAEKLRQQAEARIAQLEREAGELRRQAASGTVSEAARIKREQQVTNSAADISDPVDRKRAEDAMRAKLEAQDNAVVQERLRAIESETDLMRKQAALAKLPAREREIELRILEDINRAKVTGNELTDEEIKRLRLKYAEQADGKKIVEAAQENADRFKGVWDSAAQSIGSSLEEAISQSMEKGKVDAKEILKGLLQDITMSLVRAYITKPIVDGLTGMMGAQGMVTGPQGGSMFYAAGGVIDKPTALAMGPRMLAIGGEAGPEAVLPLKRGPDGKLGVGGGSGGGGATQIIVNDMRAAPGAEPVEVEETSGPDGQRMISILVRDEVRRQVRNGDLDKEMRSSFGVTRQLTRR